MPQHKQEGYISVPGGLVWYKTVGDFNQATPLLVLHGGPGCPHDYLEPLACLADERPVIFYDQLGCGRSDRPNNTSLWHLERFVDELAQVIQTLRLNRVHLFGHSWGSMLATEYALTQPAVLASLTQASPPLSIPRWLEDLQEYRLRLLPDTQRILNRHEAAGTTHSEEYAAATMEFYRHHLCRLTPWPEAMLKMQEGFGAEVYGTMWGPSEFFMTGNLAHYDRTSRLHEITLPTLFTCGRYDEATPEATEWYRSLTPNAKTTVFELSAHMPHLEETERYLQTLRAFLTPLG